MEWSSDRSWHGDSGGVLVDALLHLPEVENRRSGHRKSCQLTLVCNIYTPCSAPMSMRIEAGDKAPDLVLPSIDGNGVRDVCDERKRVIFTFFRFSTCPFCNIRIDDIMKRWGEFHEDTVMVGVFDAKIDELTKGEWGRGVYRSP